MVNVFVTGGAGFIGSNFVKFALETHKDWNITNLDKLTYAGRLENLQDLDAHPRHQFVQGDITNEEIVGPLVHDAQIIVNFAAETHVDRSLENARNFIQTDVYGTYVLLDAARRAPHLERFIQISTDEVYGNVPVGKSSETHELSPRNPYAASKAGADRLAYSYWATFEIPVIITRASNNYGCYQHPEKVIPLFISNALDNQQLPLYGDGKNVRDWLFVLDHCKAIDLLISKGQSGEVYNIGAGNEISNIELTHQLLAFLDRPRSLINFVPDRLGHDRRYSLDVSKLHSLGWQPTTDFSKGLQQTVDWYQNNEWWWRPVKQASLD